MSLTHAFSLLVVDYEICFFYHRIVTPYVALFVYLKNEARFIHATLVNYLTYTGLILHNSVSS